MRKAYYGPLMRMLMRALHNKKIIGVASRDEKRVICKRVSELIFAVDTNRTQQEIFMELQKKLKIVYTKQLPAFGGNAAMTIKNTLYIDKEDADYLIDNEGEDLRDQEAVSTIVHECIHKLQNATSLIKFRGFMEAATELKTFDATSRPKSHLDFITNRRYNIPSTAFNDIVAIMNQMKVMFGEEGVADLALRGNLRVLNNLEHLIGKDSFKMLTKDMNYFAFRGIENKNAAHDFTTWQDILSKTFFEKKFGEVKSQEDAEALLRQMREMDLARIKDKGGKDGFFQQYYSAMAAKLQKQYPNINQDLLEYQQPQLNPVIYQDEAVEELDTLLYSQLQTPTLESFKNLRISEYKRYRYCNGSNVYEVITREGNPCFFNMITQEGEMEGVYIDNFMEQQYQESGFNVEVKDGKIFISIGQPVSIIPIESQELQEVALNISKKQIYEEMVAFQEDTGRGSFFTKLLNRIRGIKTLQPYSKVCMDYDFEEQVKPWELSPYEKSKFKTGAAEKEARGATAEKDELAGQEESKPETGKGDKG